MKMNECGAMDRDFESHSFINIWFWRLIFITLVAVVVLVAVKKYSIAVVVIFVFVSIISLLKPIYGIVAVIAFFSCDQFINGVSPATFSPGRYLMLVNILASLPVFFKSNRYLNSLTKKQFLMYYLLAFLAVVSLMWAPDIEKGSLYILKLVILILWSRLALPLLADRRLLETLSALMCVVTFLVGLIVLFGDVGRVSHINDRFLLEGLGINSIATSFGMVVVFSILYFRSSVTLWKKIALSAIIVVIYISILKMGTRSVAIGVPIAFILGAVISKPKKVLRYLMYTLISAALFYAVIFFAVSNQIITGRLANRFLGVSEVTTFTENSRVALAARSLSYILQNPIGTGVGNENVVFSKYGYRVALYEGHNTLLSTLVQFGLVGFVILITLLMFLILNIMYIKDDEYRGFCAMLCIFFFLMLMKASILQTRLYWIPFTLILASVERYFRDSQPEYYDQYQLV